jgi:hypothetical protein
MAAILVRQIPDALAQSLATELHLSLCLVTERGAGQQHEGGHVAAPS